MVKQTTLELTHVLGADADSVVCAVYLPLRAKSTQEPLAGSVTQAFFRVTENNRRRMSLELGDRISWNNDTAVLSFSLLNSDISALKEGADYEYAVAVVHNGNLLIVKAGPLVFERVE